MNTPRAGTPATRKIGFRVTEAERETIKRLAGDEHLAVYLRRKALGDNREHDKLSIEIYISHHVSEKLPPAMARAWKRGQKLNEEMKR